MTVDLIPVPGIPEILPGDDLAVRIVDALGASRIALLDGDVVVVTQKVVSKAEGRLVRVGPDGKAAWVARESRRVVARRGDLLIAQTRQGLVCANAGVDASNVPEGMLSLLPEDPDASAERLRGAIARASGSSVAVVVTDTFGRAWREGVVNVAIGAAGLPALVDIRGTPDAGGRELEVTVVALADEIAAASGLTIGKADGIPVAVVRGVRWTADPAPARALVRDPSIDLFRESALEAVRGAVAPRAFSGAAVAREAIADAVAAAAPTWRDGRAPASRSLAVLAIDSHDALARATAALGSGETSGGSAAMLFVVWSRRDGPDPASLVEAGRAARAIEIAVRARGLAAIPLPTVLACRDALRAALSLPAASVTLAGLALGVALSVEADPAVGAVAGIDDVLRFA